MLVTKKKEFELLDTYIEKISIIEFLLVEI